jgi:hypothetical protein
MSTNHTGPKGSRKCAFVHSVTKSVIGLLKNLQIPHFHVKSILTRIKWRLQGNHERELSNI